MCFYLAATRPLGCCWLHAAPRIWISTGAIIGRVAGRAANLIASSLQPSSPQQQQPSPCPPYVPSSVTALLVHFGLHDSIPAARPFPSGAQSFALPRRHSCTIGESRTSRPSSLHHNISSDGHIQPDPRNRLVTDNPTHQRSRGLFQSSR